MDALPDDLAQLVATEGMTALQYGSAQGIPELRRQICEVMALEGLQAHADDVTVTVGSQLASDMVTRIFCDPGDVVLAEAPSYVGAHPEFPQSRRGDAGRCARSRRARSGAFRQGQRDSGPTETSLLPMAIDSDGAQLGAVYAELIARAVAHGCTGP